MTTEPSDKICVVCRVHLMVTTTQRYIGDPLHRIIGPGGANQMTTLMQTDCPKCGLLYVTGGGIKPDGQTFIGVTPYACAF